MPLTAGTTLGSYEILAPLGAGGMGEVYRAKDLDLKREVAIKVLPAGLADDADRLNRFRREAELLAALNHPHVAQIYGLTKTPDGAPALVMELVDGATLAETLARGPLPVDRAVALAVQIADGLDAAHEAGVVHRDLKPANIKVRPDGTVKLLDFGLARSTTTPPHDTHAATVLSPAVTQPGVVLGTPAYMSPEQARGQIADVRSDIWAFGCVLFELLTGRTAFPGNTIADVTAAILEREPNWSALPAASGDGVRRVLRRCLTKDRRQRYGAIVDARFDLSDVTAAATSTTTDDRRHRLSTGLTGLMGALAGLGAGALWITFISNPAAQSNPDTLTGAVLAPDRVQLAQPGHAGITFTHDGSALLFAAVGDGQREQLLIRPLDGSDERVISGTLGGRTPAASRDGRQLAFTANGSLLTIPLAGGRSTVLAEAPHLHGIAWSRDGLDLYYVPTVTGGIWRVPATGGTPVQVTTPSAQEGEISHEWPALSPNGRCLVFATNAQTRPLWDSHLIALDINTGTRTRVVSQAIGPQFGPGGDLFFMFRDGEVGTARLSEDCRSLTSEPVGLGVRPWLVTGAAYYAVGPHGEFAFVTAPDLTKRTVAWTDGATSRELSGSGAFHSIAVAPDGRTFAATTLERTLLVTSVDRSAWTVAAKDIALTTLAWMRNANRVVFSSAVGKLVSLPPPFVRGEPLTDDAEGRLLYPLSWHPDGSLLGRTIGVAGLWRLENGRTRPVPLAGGLLVTHADVDPSGELVAFASDYSGRYEVYVQDILGQEPMTQVSSGAGAMEPHWSRDGRRLYFASGPSSIAVVEVTRKPLAFSKPAPVAGIVNKSVPVGDRFTFAVLPDGRVAYVKEAEGSRVSYFRVRQDWRSLLASNAGVTSK